MENILDTSVGYLFETLEFSPSHKLTFKQRRHFYLDLIEDGFYHDCRFSDAERQTRVPEHTLVGRGSV